MTARPGQRELVQTVLRDPVHWPAFGFGLGLMPRAPGTFGSLLGVPLWWLTGGDVAVQAAVAVAALAFGVWVCGESARRIGVHDHGGIVWDEVVGMYLTLLVVPAEPRWILAAFVLFRLMDIWKPWPIRELDHRLHGGLGIMLDDVVAAVFAAILLLFFRFLL
ncbi:MAG: phosphatidylglycerophosphatase A [Gammaproteobacteria bacterium]|nr:phosphatidylglycerophosphatase A [Gammaproteobacteria bacterium]